MLDFSEFPPPKSERKGHARMHPDFLNVPEPGFYLSPIEENSEASTISGQSKIVSESHGKSVEAPMEYDHTRKYHTYPKSRIPVARWSKEQRFGNFMMDRSKDVPIGTEGNRPGGFPTAAYGGQSRGVARIFVAGKSV